VARLVVELTNRCNLSCLHCFPERNAGGRDLPFAILEKVFSEARNCGIDHLTFTGGEPSLYRGFDRVVAGTCDAGCRFSFVSNGTRFLRLLPLLTRHRAWLQTLTFSLDGAREQTHDRQRGPGSFRQVARAATVCIVRDIPFTFNMVLTSRNVSEIPHMIELAKKLGARGVRFGHLMPESRPRRSDLFLTAHERRAAESEIRELARIAPLPVAMAAGYFSEDPYFRCAPLSLTEYNLDCLGNMTFCCQLSGHPDMASGPDRIGNLHEISLAEACLRFRRFAATYMEDKRRFVERGEFREIDHFPCHYCVGHMTRAGAGTRDVIPEEMHDSARP
jgi:MoaA/NifB/PqqE/SkfB family radical SAM enzyme